MNTIEQAHRVGPFVMPESAKEVLAFINRTPLVSSLLYDLDLLPEQITDWMRWTYMVTVCNHMEGALAEADAALRASHSALVKALEAIFSATGRVTEDVLCAYANDKSEPGLAEEARALLQAHAAVRAAKELT